MHRHVLACVLLFAVVSPSIASGQQWQALFNGIDFQGWTQQNGKPVASPGWTAEGGMLHLDRRNGRGGNLLSEEVYGDFEMVFEWKLAKGANNGIKYRVNRFDGQVLGIEYQVIDDVNNPSLRKKHKTASLYDIYEPIEHQLFRPEGEFNRSRILVQGNHIQHWLNGHLVNEALVGSEEWNERLAKSKFHDVEGFGVIPTGHIMITDHSDEVWYRNMFIRRLDVQCPVVVNVQPNCCCDAAPNHKRRGWLFRRRR